LPHSIAVYLEKQFGEGVGHSRLLILDQLTMGGQFHSVIRESCHPKDRNIIIFTFLNISCNIFRIMNIKTISPEEQIAQLLRSIDQPARLRILMAIGQGEACVCHLEAMLGLRQAYISQHLMALRQAGILTARREGRYIYYRLSDQQLLELIQMTAAITGVDENTMQTLIQNEPLPLCECPNCAVKLQDTEGAS